MWLAEDLHVGEFRSLLPRRHSFRHGSDICVRVGREGDVRFLVSFFLFFFFFSFFLVSLILLNSFAGSVDGDYLWEWCSSSAAFNNHGLYELGKRSMT